MPAHIYRFGPFELDSARRELRRAAAPLVLPARAFEVLVYLIEHRERAVGRDELIAAVWGRADVSDDLLNHTVVKIRRALEDTGNEQRTIRTVPRFGYRWVMPVDAAPAALASAVAAPPSIPDAASPATVAGEVVSAVAVAAPAAMQARTRRRGGVLLVLLALAAFVISWGWLSKPQPLPHAGGNAVQELVLPALVLPAEIDAPADWAWLRLGLMDLVANRLRDAQLRTLPSESVMGLLRQHAGEGEQAQRDAALAAAASLRVLPQVRFDGKLWTVRLSAQGDRPGSAQASAGDAISAARSAADQLLGSLGFAAQAFYGDHPTPAVEDLLQRTGAAMLADQLTQARELIEHATAEVRDAAEVQQRMAQIELRAGDYPAVEQRLTPLLDRLSAQREPRLRARALLTLATSFVRRNQIERASDAYTEVLAMHPEHPDPEVLGIAHLGRGLVLAQQDRVDEATAELGRARIELETSGDQLAIATVDVNLGDFQMQRYHPAAALPMLQQAAQHYAQLGAREGLAYAAVAQARASQELLEPAAALAALDRVWPPQAHTSNVRMRWMLTQARADVLLSLGRLDEAQAAIEELRHGADASRDAPALARNELAAAALSWLRGDAAAAATAIDSAVLQELARSDKPAYVRALALAARAQRAIGRRDEAEHLAVQLRDWVAAQPDDWRRIQVALSGAEQAWEAGQGEHALQMFADAMRQAEQLNVPADLVGVAEPYVAALIASQQIDTAQAVAGRIAHWADRDARAAWSQVRLFRALGQADAERRARVAAQRLGAGPLALRDNAG